MILVKPFNGDSVSVGGIIVPDSCVGESNKVLIVKTSAGTHELKEGDIGFRVKDWGEKIIIDDENYYLMSPDSIIALEN